MKGNVPVITDVEMTSDDFTRHLRGDILTTVQQLVSIMLWGSWRYGSRVYVIQHLYRKNNRHALIVHIFNYLTCYSETEVLN